MIYTLVMTNIAMENGPFIDDFPIKTSIYEGFSMAMLNNQMVSGIFPISSYIIQPPWNPQVHRAARGYPVIHFGRAEINSESTCIGKRKRDPLEKGGWSQDFTMETLVFCWWSSDL